MFNYSLNTSLGKQNMKDDLSPVAEDEEQRRSLSVIYTHRLFVEQNGND